MSEMRLTAEQVEDVRTVAWYTGAGLSRAPMAEIHRLRALFPATEPAEDAPCAICNVNETNHAGVSYYHPFTTELGPFDNEGNDRPAPAEPAEEEAKAEATDDGYVIADAHEALGKAGLNHVQRSDAINQLHNAGLVIRRRTPSLVVEETKAAGHRSVIHSNRTIKTVGEALSYAETALLNAYPESAQRAHYAEVIAELLRDVAGQRPVGSNGKHGELHTPTCGCEDVPASSPVVPAPTEAEAGHA